MTATPKRRGRPPMNTNVQNSIVSLPRPAHTWEYEQVVYTEPPSRAELTYYGALGWELIVIYADTPPMHDATFYAVFKREVVNG